MSAQDHGGEDWDDTWANRIVCGALLALFTFGPGILIAWLFA